MASVRDGKYAMSVKTERRFWGRLESLLFSPSSLSLNDFYNNA